MLIALIGSNLMGFRALPSAAPSNLMDVRRHPRIVAQDTDGETNEVLMASLQALLATVTKLEEKVDTLSRKVDELQAVSPTTDAPGTATAASGPTTSPPAAPASGPTASPPAAAPTPPPAAAPDETWDGSVDEGAWFDADDDDNELGDWRDVRRLNKLL